MHAFIMSFQFTYNVHWYIKIRVVLLDVIMKVYQFSFLITVGSSACSILSIKKILKPC